MARHSPDNRWKRFKDYLLDPEKIEDRKREKEALNKYYKSDEYKESLLGLKDLIKLSIGIFRRSKGKH